MLTLAFWRFYVTVNGLYGWSHFKLSVKFYNRCFVCFYKSTYTVYVHINLNVISTPLNPIPHEVLYVNIGVFIITIVHLWTHWMLYHNSYLIFFSNVCHYWYRNCITMVKREISFLNVAGRCLLFINIY